MKAGCIYILFLLFCLSCSRSESQKEKYQTKRDNIVSVKEKIKEIPVDEILLGNIGIPYILGDYLLIEGDCAINNKCVHLFDRRSFRYVKSVIDIGAGPEEITRMGHIGIDKEHRRFYLSDFGKQKIFSYSIDSLLEKDFYVGEEKVLMDINSFPADYEYINDTLCIARVINPVGTSDFVPRVARWNMQTGKIIPISPLREDVEQKRITCAASELYGLYVEMYNKVDLLSIGDFSGNVKVNIYGPDWGDSHSQNAYYSHAVFCRDGKWIVSFSGEEYATAKTTKLLVFDIEGNYIKTLETGYDILSFCYDDKSDRLIFNFNDDIQIGYLDLKEILS